MKILYITNTEVPYRARFFNEFARHADLTVLYERKKSSNRNEQWSKGVKAKYRVKYLHGIRVKNESAFSLGILKEVLSGYNVVIVGCYNSPVQMMAILVMRLFRIPYLLNLDGEVFLSENTFKTKIKKFVLSDAYKYLVAGEKSAQSISEIAKNKDVIPYYFSSLSRYEIDEHLSLSKSCNRNDIILVVGQYYDYKGMDIALEAARMDSTLKYKFIGMGDRTKQFLRDFDGRLPENVEIIPFLQKRELEKEYQHCAMLVLPSRQECWGLVINEAASFGTPIVSTWGSGAAVEFLSDTYPQYLAKSGDAASLLQTIQRFIASENKEQYCNYLLNISKRYYIEQSVQIHLDACINMREEENV